MKASDETMETTKKPNDENDGNLSSTLKTKMEQTACSLYYSLSAHNKRNSYSYSYSYSYSCYCNKFRFQQYNTR